MALSTADTAPSVSTPTPTRPTSPPTPRWRSREALTAWLFILPSLIGFLIFTAGPVVAAGVISLLNWNQVKQLLGQDLPRTFLGQVSVPDAINGLTPRLDILMRQHLDTVRQATARKG